MYTDNKLKNTFKIDGDYMSLRLLLSVLLVLGMATNLMAQPVPLSAETEQKQNEPNKPTIEYIYVGGCIKYIQSTKQTSSK